MYTVVLTLVFQI